MTAQAINIYVDAADFFQQQKKTGTRIDLRLFAPEVVRRLNGRLGQMHYFTAPASWAGTGVRDRQQAFFRMMDALDDVELHLGRHIEHGTRDGGVRWVQRGTIGKLAARLALDAALGEAEAAVVVTGNTGYAEAIEEVREATGIQVVWGHFPHQRGLVRLFKAAGKDLEFSDDFLAAVALNEKRAQVR